MSETETLRELVKQAYDACSVKNWARVRTLLEKAVTSYSIEESELDEVWRVELANGDYISPGSGRTSAGVKKVFAGWEKSGHMMNSLRNMGCKRDQNDRSTLLIDRRLIGAVVIKPDKTTISVPMFVKGERERIDKTSVDRIVSRSYSYKGSCDEANCSGRADRYTYDYQTRRGTYQEGECPRNHLVSIEQEFNIESDSWGTISRSVRQVTGKYALTQD